MCLALHLGGNQKSRKAVKMEIPTPQLALDFLLEAEGLNPGPWITHSHHVAAAAMSIAAYHPDLDSECAYILGLLHDIGRREGVYGMRHVIDGYRFLMDKGYPDAANICITHSYPIPNVMVGSSEWDGTQDEQEFVAEYLARHPYTPYDHLIQLCDSICLPTGPVLMEKRFVDVTMRYGFNRFTIAKWRAFIKIQSEFEDVIKKSIYELLPGVVENTFGEGI
jgi:hypothetical protein